jgi:hypothetical protein
MFFQLVALVSWQLEKTPKIYKKKSMCNSDDDMGTQLYFFREQQKC